MKIVCCFCFKHFDVKLKNNNKFQNIQFCMCVKKRFAHNRWTNVIFTIYNIDTMENKKYLFD